MEKGRSERFADKGEATNSSPSSGLRRGKIPSSESLPTMRGEGGVGRASQGEREKRRQSHFVGGRVTATKSRAWTNRGKGKKRGGSGPLLHPSTTEKGKRIEKSWPGNTPMGRGRKETISPICEIYVTGSVRGGGGGKGKVDELCSAAPWNSQKGGKEEGEEGHLTYFSSLGDARAKEKGGKGERTGACECLGAGKKGGLIPAFYHPKKEKKKKGHRICV